MNKKNRKLKQKLLDKYRLVILNDDTFEEKISFNLSRLNVFVLIGFSSIILIALTTILIAFTPIREYIPGYSSTKLTKEARALSEKTLSLENTVRKQDTLINSLRKIVTGDFNLENDSDITEDKIKSNETFSPISTTKEDSLLRQMVTEEDKYNLLDIDENKNFVLFPPVKGPISQNYNTENNHLAVDIVVATGTPVKSVAEGTVIFSEWTTETGYVIIIRHTNDLISVYKHNSKLNVKQGDLVKSGEIISLSGSTGELTTGPHLHFELWSDGYALNPTNFIDF